MGKHWKMIRHILSYTDNDGLLKEDGVARKVITLI